MKRLSYSNVVSTLALAAALGLGGAYAAGKIGSNDIAKNAVLSKHIKNGEVKGGDLKKCPAGTRAFADGCWEVEANTPEVVWTAAVQDCADRGGILPDATQLIGFSRRPGITLSISEWSGEMSSNPGDGGNLNVMKISENAVIAYGAFSELHAYRCVFPRVK